MSLKERAYNKFNKNNVNHKQNALNENDYVINKNKNENTGNIEKFNEVLNFEIKNNNDKFDIIDNKVNKVNKDNVIIKNKNNSNSCNSNFTNDNLSVESKLLSNIMSKYSNKNSYNNHSFKVQNLLYSEILIGNEIIKCLIQEISNFLYKIKSNEYDQELIKLKEKINLNKKEDEISILVDNKISSILNKASSLINKKNNKDNSSKIKEDNLKINNTILKQNVKEVERDYPLIHKCIFKEDLLHKKLNTKLADSYFLKISEIKAMQEQVKTKLSYKAIQFKKVSKAFKKQISNHFEYNESFYKDDVVQNHKYNKNEEFSVYKSNFLFILDVFQSKELKVIFDKIFMQGIHSLDYEENIFLWIVIKLYFKLKKINFKNNIDHNFSNEIYQSIKKRDLKDIISKQIIYILSSISNPKFINNKDQTIYNNLYSLIINDFTNKVSIKFINVLLKENNALVKDYIEDFIIQNLFDKSKRIINKEFLQLLKSVHSILYNRGRSFFVLAKRK